LPGTSKVAEIYGSREPVAARVGQVEAAAGVSRTVGFLDDVGGNEVRVQDEQRVHRQVRSDVSRGDELKEPVLPLVIRRGRDWGSSSLRENYDICHFYMENYSNRSMVESPDFLEEIDE
jgi:hypothetical protein